MLHSPRTFSRPDYQTAPGSPMLTIKLTMTSSTTSFPGSLPVAGRRVERKLKGPEKFVGDACLVVYS